MDILRDLKLQRQKNIEFVQNSLLEEAYSILKGDFSTNNKLGLNTASLNSDSLVISEKKLNSENIYSEKDIKNCCVKYTLRFLNSKIYKSELPYDVYIKRSAFEIEIGKSIDFKILTEASNFTSPYPNTQQLLFADIGNGEYYFICQWGREYSSYRKIASLPYRNIEYLFIYILFLAVVFTIITPTTFITTKPNIDYFSMIRMAYFFWCVVFISSIFTYYVIGIRKGLNNTQWDSASFI
ncbi:MAG: hypothetical protein U0W65_12925 [Bacteroidia bacterium]